MLANETLDSLRLLTNPALNQKAPPLCLLLVGDTTLRRNLGRPYFESFVQRLRVTYTMPPLDDEEARRYVAHRLRIAGGNPDVFDPAAVDAVLTEAGGRLRVIDDLGNQALYAAFIKKAKVVGKEHVDELVEERRASR
jgi:type II secretory pathway predicted ATPase ExeA